MALWAAMLGFMLDAMDVLLYVFALQSIRAEFGLTNAQAGMVASVTLIASAVGGIGAGILADRIGRRRTLIYTILLYSLASGGAATSQTIAQLVFWRGLVGLGLGGEWSAGAVLVAESWPAKDRAKAIGFMQSGWALGYMLAAGVSAVILPRFGWRVSGSAAR
jgi:MFS family permease